MKTRSLFQIILLAVFGSLGVAGVLIFAFAVGGGNTASTIGKVVIWGTFDKSAMQSVLDTAMRDNQDLQQVSYVQKTEATYEQDLSNALAQVQGPDLFILRSDYALKDEPKVIPITYEELSRVQFQNIFAEAANPYLGKSGIIAIPFAVDPLVLYWNRDILSSAGYAVPPAYWDDVPRVSEKITQRDQSGGIQRATIAFGTYRNIENAKAILSALLMQADIPITTVRSDGTIAAALTQETGGSSSAADDALRFYTEFADPSQSDYSWSGSMQGARAAFAAGDLALYVGFASEAPLIASMNPNLNAAIAALPQLRGAARTSDFGRAYAFAVPRASGNPIGAKAVAALLDSATTSAAIARSLGISSALRKVLADPVSGNAAIFNQMTIITRIWSDPDPTQTDPLFRAMIEDTVSGASPLSQALQRAGQQMSQIISGEQ
ncbi:MAG TPA: extracellular solute-binding protein [Candidatus Paceibacterota bacterium]